jgi:hypothetical protein
MVVPQKLTLLTRVFGGPDNYVHVEGCGKAAAFSYCDKTDPNAHEICRSALFNHHDKRYTD